MSTTTSLSVDEKLDLLSAQVSALTDVVTRQEAERRRWAELTQDLAPVAQGAFDSVSRELERFQGEVSTDDLRGMTEALVRAIPTLEALLVQLNSMSELVQDVTPMAGPAMALVTDRLQELQDKGYVEFAQHGIGVVDKVVTSFDKEDIDALGDNVVLILNTVKQMTQPEIMTMLRRTMVTVQEDQVTDVKPPGTFALLREMRDPDVRRGLARTLHMLRSIGLESRPDQITEK